MTIRSVRGIFAVCFTAILMLVCAGVTYVSAAPGIEVHVNGNRVEFPDQKPFIMAETGRTYVPLRFVSEALGACVDWNGAAKTAQISTDRNHIRMPAGSKVAVVDGADVVLDAPALLVNGRTVVPLRFVSEVLGAAVEWVPPLTGPGRVTVTMVDDWAWPDDRAGDDAAPADPRAIPDDPWTLKAGESDGRTELRIESPLPFTYKAFTMAGPERLVIDLAGVGRNIPADITLGSGAVERVRTGFSEDPPAGRVVCDLTRGAGFTRYLMEASPDRRSLRVEIWTVDSVFEGRTIILDPGHGGADPGATGPTGLREKDVNLAVAFKVAPLLQAEGAAVVLTRADDIRLGADVGEDLAARSRIANSHQADLFISLHANAGQSRSSQGTSVYYYAHPVNGTQNAKLARALQTSLLCALGRADRGVHSCNFYVLKHTNMPGVLVEVAFLSNPEEEQLLAQDWFQDAVAGAIVQGIQEYYGVMP